MSFIDSIILGFIQGLTEFIPISSTGHLIIVGQLLDINDAFTFDVLLNFGTLLALIIYYRKKLWGLVVDIARNRHWILARNLIIATIPAVFVGIAFADQIAAMNTMLWVVIAMLVIVGVMMIVWGKEDSQFPKSVSKYKDVSLTTSVKIGLVQAIALIPGTSRSGVTILTGLRCGLSAKKAAEFSFLLAIPIILGASLKTLFSLEGQNLVSNHLGVFMVGNLVSFIVGLGAIHFLISLVGKRGLKDFGWYRLVLAIVLVILSLTGII